MKVIKKFFLYSLVMNLIFLPNIGFGAPGVIKDRPLFLGFSVQPNIYFVVDDSGSMGWEVTKTTEAKELYPYAYSYYTYEACFECSRTRSDGSCRSGSTTSGYPSSCSSGNRNNITIRQAWFNDRDNIDQTPNTWTPYPEPYDTSDFRADHDDIDSDGRPVEYLLELCAGYNATAFNPDQIYTPWVGYSNSTQSVSSHVYFEWNDSASSGVVGELDAGECSTNYDDRVSVSSLDSAGQQNYKNWYTYYRKRHMVAKKAISEVVSGSEARMGIATINNRSSGYYEVDDMTVDANKASLLSEVFSVTYSSGTPLRTALQRAGEYYKGTNSPIQSEDEGGSCQQNYTILMTDGYWNGDSPNVGNVDGTLVDPLVRESDKDNASNTLADVALKYYATDLDAGLANEVPTIEGVDENNAQHMVTFTVAFGVNGQNRAEQLCFRTRNG